MKTTNFWYGLEDEQNPSIDGILNQVKDQWAKHGILLRIIVPTKPKDDWILLVRGHRGWDLPILNVQKTDVSDDHPFDLYWQNDFSTMAGQPWYALFTAQDLETHIEQLFKLNSFKRVVREFLTNEG